jgi:hypothetical protein
MYLNRISPKYRNLIQAFCDQLYAKNQFVITADEITTVLAEEMKKQPTPPVVNARGNSKT